MLNGPFPEIRVFTCEQTEQNFTSKQTHFKKKSPNITKKKVTAGKYIAKKGTAKETGNHRAVFMRETFCLFRFYTCNSLGNRK